MKKVSLAIVLILMTVAGTYAQVRTSSTGRVDRITTDFTTRIVDGQYNRELWGTGWISGVGDYLFLKHGGGNTEAGTYGFRISDHYGFEFGKNDFSTSFLRIKTNGNVGIGTMEPGSNLTVLGTSGIELRQNNNASQFMKINPMVDVSALNPGTSVAAAQITNLNLQHLVFDIKANDQGDSFAIRTDADLDGAVDKIAMVVKANGNVGVGTTSPSSNLTVVGNTGIELKKLATANQFMKINPVVDVSNLNPGGSSSAAQITNLNLQHLVFDIIANDQGDSFAIRTDANLDGEVDKIAMVVKPSGNMGIGTTTPSEKLQVNGIIRVARANNEDNNSPGITCNSDDDFSYNNSYLNQYGLGFHNGPTDNKLDTYISGHWGVNIFTGSKNRMSITNNGNVGIGTTDPKGYKLAVAGKAVAEEIKVKLQAQWPDYVFEDTYELPTLDKVAEHITEKGHLPNIPSATEVAEQGIYLGEMNAKLLEKIEELTLYTIAQEKEIAAQKAKIEAFEKQLTKIQLLEQKLEDLIQKQNNH